MIKRTFSFDDEPISGTTFMLRILLGHMLIVFFGLGLWFQAAASYKRAGRFGWRRRYRVLTSMVVPMFSISTLLYNSMDSFYDEVPGLLVVNAIASSIYTLFVVLNGRPIQQSHV